VLGFCRALLPRPSETGASRFRPGLPHAYLARFAAICFAVRCRSPKMLEMNISTTEAGGGGAMIAVL
jgi:hypothetical protein